MAKKPVSSCGAAGVLAFFGLFWSGMTLLFDGIFVRDAVLQLRTLTYSSTHGIVTRTDLECISDEDGQSYRPIIKYAYTVAGKQYEGDRRRYAEESFRLRVAQRIVEAYRVEGPVEVHYAPHDPAEAALVFGLEGTDLSHAMFMLPFNLIMLVLWIAGFGGVYHWLYRPPAGGAKVWAHGDKLRVRLSSWQPLYTGAAVAGALSFAGVFIVIPRSGDNPSMPVMLTAWAVIIGGGLLAYLWHRSRLGPDGCDLLLDTLGHRLTMLATHGRKEAIMVPGENILSIEVEEVQKRDSDGDVSYGYVPILVFTDDAGSTRRERLVEWSDESRAEGLASWLRERLRIPAHHGHGPTPEQLLSAS